ncbi:hypothetical protein MARPO_0158s0043 [Marchantia polymorpha]|uniref:Uncharacterized protein n=1 Tax=Marchantia polymorpha TaxID=3197 RepID=A0A2R6W477_MARPO|nr:hypothetical protein MARPO_0158s0043 [Marchantia polymorpha]|eukprot:PTQ28668.1 hypothetical protein MARPO_0158s0043 [Marchantia polymorpha]
MPSIVRLVPVVYRGIDISISRISCCPFDIYAEIATIYLLLDLESTITYHFTFGGSVHSEHGNKSLVHSSLEHS